VLAVARGLWSPERSPETTRVLDWGGGPGFLSFLLQSFGFATTYYDLKYDYASYTYVLGQLRGDVRFIGEEQVLLPFEDESFDAAISFGVLEHVPDAAGSLAELHRVLASGGKLFVYHFPNRYGYIEGVAKLLGRATHEFRLSRGELGDLLVANGFAPGDFSYRYLVPRNLTDMPRIRGFIDRHAEGVYAFDSTLTKVPGLRVLATTLNVVATKA
jgi:SAM-dependent methyltransferase